VILYCRAIERNGERAHLWAQRGHRGVRSLILNVAILKVLTNKKRGGLKVEAFDRSSLS
jgi:hypothetical protein